MDKSKKAGLRFPSDFIEFEHKTNALTVFNVVKATKETTSPVLGALTVNNLALLGHGLDGLALLGLHHYLRQEQESGITSSGMIALCPFNATNYSGSIRATKFNRLCNRFATVGQSSKQQFEIKLPFLMSTWEMCPSPFAIE